MKKILILSIMALFIIGSYADARSRYDDTGRNIISNDSIRSHSKNISPRQKRQMAEEQKKAAAAKINYEYGEKRYYYPTFQPNLNYKYDPSKDNRKNRG